MNIYSVDDPEFAPYGRIVNGVDTTAIAEVLKKLPLKDEMRYVASEPALEALSTVNFFRDHVFAGMPIQMGSVTGRNSRLDCLEHHMCSEVIMDTEDVVLLLAKREDIEMLEDPDVEFGTRLQLDTSKVKAFSARAGQIVEMYNSTLHFAPCGMNSTYDYRGLVVLSQGTNGPKHAIHPVATEDLTLWARDNWLLVHADSSQAKEGAYIGIVGENIDLAHASQGD
jgi:ureidoglycolate hydrolase